ncbi:heterokaryon incompatibility protein-domain-containing protein [Hypoxylon fuscum]|nr:heterokaryon incompatibility protein-domain-containing protein [Hypoxylon fuscum]
MQHFSIFSDFQYEPLPDTKNSIRLVEILDLDETRPVEVKCQMTTWHMEQAPTYHAISYTWGDPTHTSFIQLNSKHLEVRQNCEYVLKQALQHGGSRYHWIDAICINQSDNKEKSDQV